MAVDLAPDGTRRWSRRASSVTTCSCSTASCRVHGDEVCRSVRERAAGDRDPDADRRRRRWRTCRGAGARRRRLPRQAVPVRRAGGADPGAGTALAAEPAAGAAATATWSWIRRAGALTRGGREVELGRKEFGVLEALMGAEGATVSAEELLERVWDEHTDPFTNVVRMTIMTLRRKLGDPQVVETVIGVGYRMALMRAAAELRELRERRSRAAPDDPLPLTALYGGGVPGHRRRAADDRLHARPPQPRRAAATSARRCAARAAAGARADVRRRPPVARTRSWSASSSTQLVERRAAPAAVRVRDRARW